MLIVFFVAVTVLVVAGLYGIARMLERPTPATPPLDRAESVFFARQLEALRPDEMLESTFAELKSRTFEPVGCRLEYAVLSGTGAGWGIYDDLAEAEARRANVATSHPSARVFYRVKGGAS